MEGERVVEEEYAPGTEHEQHSRDSVTLTQGIQTKEPLPVQARFFSFAARVIQTMDLEVEYEAKDCTEVKGAGSAAE